MGKKKKKKEEEEEEKKRGNKMEFWGYENIIVFVPYNKYV